MKNRARFFLATVFGLLAASRPASADVKPAALFSDHAVLQREASIPVWGTADASESVTVTLAGVTASTVADASGRWRVKLGAVPTGGPYAMTVVGQNRLTISDVLVGDVWLCSGQSNMQYAMAWHPEKYTADVAASDDPLLRCFTVVNETSARPLDELVQHAQQKWEVATPRTVPGFTAVGYYFAKEIRRQIGVPVGLIHSSWSGTPGEAWMGREAFDADPALRAFADTQIRAMEARPEQEKAFPRLMADWEAANSAADKGNTGEAKGWANPEFDDAPWKTASVPANFGHFGMKSGGSVWLRKSVDLPPSAAGHDFVWRLNWSADDRVAYFNGTKLAAPAAPTPGPPKFYGAPRTFLVPGALVKAGKNTLALRVFSHSDRGSVWFTTQRMGIPSGRFGPDADVWRYQVESENPPLTRAALEAMPTAPVAERTTTPTYIFNAKIAPLTGFAVRGALWYQGENNTQSPKLYRKLLPALVGDWRRRWGQGDFPFYIVQLPNWGVPASQPGSSPWADVREAQAMTAKAVPNSGIAVTIDIGQANDMHPANKKDVGKRLALLAMAKTYRKPVACSGPEYACMKIDRGDVAVTFAHADGGLVAKGGPLQTFAVAGADRKFVPADARIDGDRVIVSSARVPQPVAVRYAWADNPAGCNLYNGSGLPAAPFRTDDWPQ